MMKQIKNRVRQLGVTLTLLALLVTQVLAAVPAYLIPGGNTVGIKLYTRGLVITAVSDGMARRLPGLRPGTRSCGGWRPVRTAQSLCAHLQEGKPVVLTVLRGEQEAKFLVSPEKTEDGCCLGLTPATTSRASGPSPIMIRTAAASARWATASAARATCV